MRTPHVHIHTLKAKSICMHNTPGSIMVCRQAPTTQGGTHLSGGKKSPTRAQETKIAG